MPRRRALLQLMLWPLAGGAIPRLLAQPAIGATVLPRVVLRTAHELIVVTPGHATAGAPSVHRIALVPNALREPAPAVSSAGIWMPVAGPALEFRALGSLGVPDGAAAVRYPLPAAPHALACTADGQWAFAAFDHHLHLIDRAGRDSLVHEGRGLERRTADRVRALQLLPHRRSVLVDWHRVGEWWEISLDPAAPPIFDGLVHDYRMGEAIATPGYRQPRRIPLSGDGRPVPQLVAALRGQPWALGQEGEELVVVHLDVRRIIFRIRLHDARPSMALMAAPGIGQRQQLWLPAGDALLVFTPSSWAAPQLHPLPAALQSLSLAPGGGLLWALAGSADDVQLVERPLDAGPQQPWRAVASAPGRIGQLLTASGQVLGALVPAGRSVADGVDIVWFAAGGSVAWRQHVPGASLVSEAHVVPD